MLTAELILRIIAAAFECQAEILKKASADQVQALIDRHDKRMVRYEALLHKIMPESDAA